MKQFLLLTGVLFCCVVSAQKLPDSYTDGKYISVNGAKLYVVLVGTGDPLNIIPGGPGGAHLGTLLSIPLQRIMRSFISMPSAVGKVIQPKT